MCSNFCKNPLIILVQRRSQWLNFMLHTQLISLSSLLNLVESRLILVAQIGFHADLSSNSALCILSEHSLSLCKPQLTPSAWPATSPTLSRYAPTRHFGPTWRWTSSASLWTPISRGHAQPPSHSQVLSFCQLQSSYLPTEESRNVLYLHKERLFRAQSNYSDC